VTQKQLIVKYLNDNGSITSYEAYIELGITQLATRISELKEKGYVFKNERQHTVNRYGKKTHFDKYLLVKAGEQI